jgi:low affinity Fe/Cu permease
MSHKSKQGDQNGATPNLFSAIATKSARALGSLWAFASAIVVVLVWAASGPLFNFSDTWQLVINTGTTIVTFLMVFLIQNSQNRDGKAIQLKLDELILTVERAHTEMINIEELSEEELERISKVYKRKKEAAEGQELDRSLV